MRQRLKWRFALWLGQKAGAVCAWAHDLEIRSDPRPPCPDCGASECYCQERADQQGIYADIDAAAYFDGKRDGYDQAREEFA